MRNNPIEEKLPSYIEQQITELIEQLRSIHEALKESPSPKEALSQAVKKEGLSPAFFQHLMNLGGHEDARRRGLVEYGDPARDIYATAAVSSVAGISPPASRLDVLAALYYVTGGQTE